jgi:hypothetical protein
MNNFIKKTLRIKAIAAALCVVFISFIISGCGNDELNDYFWFGDKKKNVSIIEGKFYIEFYSVDEHKVKEECVKRGIKLSDVHSIRDWVSFSKEGTESAGAIIFTDLMSGFLEGSYEQCSYVLSSALYSSPFYKNIDENCEIKVTSLFFVVLKSGKTQYQIEELAKKNSVEMIGVDKIEPNCYLLACTNHSKGNALEMANLFYKSGLFVASYPNCINCGNI